MKDDADKVKTRREAEDDHRAKKKREDRVSTAFVNSEQYPPPEKTDFGDPTWGAPSFLAPSRKVSFDKIR